jgi:hypothetical protein
MFVSGRILFIMGFAGTNMIPDMNPIREFVGCYCIANAKIKYVN